MPTKLSTYIFFTVITLSLYYSVQSASEVLTDLDDFVDDKQFLNVDKTYDREVRGALPDFVKITYVTNPKIRVTTRYP